ncbi:FHIP family protein CPIJ015043-like isoform X2 [Panonychus citri]|uniref:FHIP family protein CPIJ015043-like isoform X2 n=1 Tax=Panonychus citri TaxID=50023 RepID=UPI0023073BE3|nr:FHIP family protein CPIJ015043-like isoform X2 [Panonychus citri]
MNNWRNRRSNQNNRLTPSTVDQQYEGRKFGINNQPEPHNSQFYSLPSSQHTNNNHQRSINDHSLIDNCDYTIKHLDPSVMLATFKNHWYQTSVIMTQKTITSNGFNPQVPKSKVITTDDITSVVNNIDQMIALLLQEAKNFTNTSNTKLINDTSSSQHSKSMDLSCSPSPSPSSLSSSSSSSTTLLDYFLMENILDQIFNWSCDIGEFTNIMKIEQLKSFDLLLSRYNKDNCIFQSSVIKILHQLLSRCSKTCPLDVEKRLVSLLNTICQCIGRDNQLLQLFFNDNGDHENRNNNEHNDEFKNSDYKSKYFSERKEIESRFLVFSLLISFVHREGAIGQQARNGLLQIMPISQTNESLSQYIANDSNLGPVMATILSGLYSSLPRKLITLDDRLQITEQDIADKPELQNFLSSLDFCNFVVKVSHPLIKKQMINLIYQGFLVPVIGPALHEDTIQQIITTTSYLELCLRRVTEPQLLKIFLKFICIEKFDDQRILNTLIARIQATTKLSLITLVLIRTIIDLDCEDVILELLLRYLIDCKIIFDNKHDHGMESDVSEQFLYSAKKFFTLVPTFNQHHHHHQQQQQIPLRSFHNSLNLDHLSPSPSRSTSSSTYSSYDYNVTSTVTPVNCSAINADNNFFESCFNYLDEAHSAILDCKVKTSPWLIKYESKNMNGSNDNQMISPPSDSGIFLTTSSSSNFNLDCSKLSGLTDMTCENIQTPTISTTTTTTSSSTSSPTSTNEPSHNSEAEMIGPFLSNLLSRLSQLPFNDYYVNLQLTGIISRLATFPEYHLKSLFLNCDLKLHKNVRSLFSILINLKKQLEDMSRKIDNFNELYLKEKQNLSSLTLPVKRSGSAVSEESETSFSIKSNADKKVKKRRSLKSFLPWVTSNSKLEECPSLESLDNGYKFINKKYLIEEDEGIDGSTKSSENVRIIQACIIFEEFIKELAAISMEHYLLSDIEPNQFNYHQLLPQSYFINFTTN